MAGTAASENVFMKLRKINFTLKHAFPTSVSETSEDDSVYFMIGFP